MVQTKKEVREQARREPSLPCLCYGVCVCEKEEKAIDPEPPSESVFMPYFGGQWESNRQGH